MVILRFLDEEGSTMYEQEREENEVERHIDLFDDKGQHGFSFAAAWKRVTGETIYDYDLEYFIPWPDDVEVAQC